MQGPVSTLDDQELENEEEEFSKDEQVTLLIDLMNECMKALFRIGILVRREVTYDRFQRALQRSRFLFPKQFDTDYVEQKYPKLRNRGKELATRLGRANAKRRQFIKYGRDHRTRLEMDIDVCQENEPEPKAMLSIDLEAPTEQLSSKATTFVMPAENWNSELLAPPIEDEDDGASFLTASTTFDSKKSLKLFKKHVATHQEQLAIFTVPKSTDYDGPDESGRNAGSDVSVHVSEGSAAMSDASGAFVVGAESPSINMDKRNNTAVEEAAGDSKPRVLIAEDNPINLAVLRRLLLHEGIDDITAAKDGQEAYDMVKENFDHDNKFDLIFMDIQMPRLSGLASTQLIRTLGCETPIVAVTPASSDTSRAHELIQRGVNEVILKPFRQPTIRKVLQRFAIVAGDAGRSSLARELYMHDSYQTPTVDVESLISPLEAFLATASSGDVGESPRNDSDISSVTALIAEALRGPGRVKTADLIDLLPNLHHNDIMNLRTEYKRLVKVGAERKGVNVAKHIRARLKDDDNRLMTAAYATALGMWESEGYWISLSLAMGNEARKGHQLLIESLLGKSNTEARLIEDGFRIHSNKLEREHGTSLESFLDPYLRKGEAWFREAVKAVLSGHKMEERDHSGQPQPIDMQLVEKDVDELFEAVAGERGAATTISQIVILRSDAHLREVLTIYQRKYESDFLTDALQGTMQLRDDVLFHVLYGVLNRPTRDAWLLHQALTPSGNDGTQHEVLTSRLVRAHWNGHYLSAVKEAYCEQYGQHLTDDIASGTSGEWGAFCIALAQSNLQWDERPSDRHAAV
ncbi:hypothetical protein SLS64_000985 [Diaporthe eres]